MQKAKSSAGLLIVVELGAEWPTGPLPNAWPRRIVAQAESESPARFALRVSEYSSDLLARGLSMEQVIIACSERLDEQAQIARGELARSAALSLGQTRGSAVLLFACDRNAGRSRAALSAFVAELNAEWRGSQVYAKLRFSDEAADVVRPQARHSNQRTKKSARRERAQDDAERVA